MPKKTIEELKREISMIESRDKRKSERARLEKKLKTMKFQHTVFGKVTSAVGSFAEKITRPKPKSKNAVKQKMAKTQVNKKAKPVSINFMDVINKLPQ